MPPKGATLKRVLLLPAVLLVVLAPTTSADPIPSMPTGTAFSFNATNALQLEKQKWKYPCRSSRPQRSIGAIPDGQIIRKSDDIAKMRKLINLMLIEIDEYGTLANTSDNWSSATKKFEFLRPFNKNKQSWERRLSVYWASLKLVLMFLEKYPWTGIIDNNQKGVLVNVNNYSKDLLCYVQTEMASANVTSKPLSVKKMSETISFAVSDASQSKIYIWFILCRLECFIRNMRQHLRNKHNQDGQLRCCRKCPYSKAENKRCKLHNQQRLHKQQQQQPRQQRQRKQQRQKQLQQQQH